LMQAVAADPAVEYIEGRQRPRPPVGPQRCAIQRAMGTQGGLRLWHPRRTRMGSRRREGNGCRRGRLGRAPACRPAHAAAGLRFRQRRAQRRRWRRPRCRSDRPR
jgi:hypothetical protein